MARGLKVAAPDGYADIFSSWWMVFFWRGRLWAHRRLALSRFGEEGASSLADAFVGERGE